MPTRDTPSPTQDYTNADGARKRAKGLRSDVEASSSQGARTWQTLNHLAGKEAGDAADASIRHRENMKESEAEDLDTRAKQLDKSGDDKRMGRNAGEVGKKWKDSFK